MRKQWFSKKGRDSKVCKSRETKFNADTVVVLSIFEFKNKKDYESFNMKTNET